MATKTKKRKTGGNKPEPEHNDKFRFEEVNGCKVAVFHDKITTEQAAAAIAKKKSEKEDVDDPFAIVNLELLVDRFRDFNGKMPRVHPFYAMKCNSDPMMLKTLGELGAGFDCASKREMEAILDNNIAPPERIIYSNPCKSRNYIKFAEQVGVRMMTFDNEEELEKIASLYENAEWVTTFPIPNLTRLVIRIEDHDPTAMNVLSSKFGCEASNVAPRLMQKAYDLGMKVIGVSFHVGSGAHNASAYRFALKHCKSLFETGAKIGHEMRLVDLGGGFPGHDDSRITFAKIADVINPTLDEFFPKNLYPNLKIIAEPGRYVAMEPVAVIVNVLAKTKVPLSRVTNDPDDLRKECHFYYVNDGIYGSFNCIESDGFKPKGQPLQHPEEDKKEVLYPSIVWGPTCASHDKIEEFVHWKELNVGDWVYYPYMGAYTAVTASTFNGFYPPVYKYIIDESTWRFLKKNQP